jgi:hypothetical protein
MSQLRALQEELKKILFLKEDAPATSSLWPEGIPTRLNVYRNTIHINWQDALQYDFPLTKKQFSAPEWELLETRFFGQNPPHHWDLNMSVAPFPDFLKRQKVPAFVKELADYEWHDLRVFIDRSPVRRGQGVTNPTAIVRVYQHQIFFWVEEGAQQDQPPEQKPEVLVFYRDWKNTCHIREADPLMLLLMEHYKTRGASLEELEPVRRQLLPMNHVPLERVRDEMRDSGLLLL